MMEESRLSYIKSSISIEDILLRLGKRADNKNNMFFSPFRTERTPSMSVTFKDGVWQWFDHGNGKCGSNIDLYMQLTGCSFKEAISELDNNYFRSANYNPVSSVQVHDKVKGNEILRTRNHIRDLSLYRYIETRCVDISVVERFCKEVDYRNLTTGRQYTALGFPCDGGSWTLRSEKFKGSTGAGISTFKGENHSKVVVFEGFYNFLSWTQLSGGSEVPLPCDAVVLNSTVNLPKALGFLREHDTVDCYLDNDQTGRKCLETLMELCAGVTVHDRSSAYSGHNDLNDYIIHQSSTREEHSRNIHQVKF